MLVIKLPDGEKLMYTHTCRPNVPWLPEKAKVVHIVPGLAHAYLVSIKKLCNAGCKFRYNKYECRVYFKHKILWVVQRDPTTGLWFLPITPYLSMTLIFFQTVLTRWCLMLCLPRLTTIPTRCPPRNCLSSTSIIIYSDLPSALSSRPSSIINLRLIQIWPPMQSIDIYPTHYKPLIKGI